MLHCFLRTDIFYSAWWRHQMETFSRYWPFVQGIHWSPVNSPHKCQCREALMFSLICVWINCWVNNREAGALRRYRGHYEVIVMYKLKHSEFQGLCPRFVSVSVLVWNISLLLVASKVGSLVFVDHMIVPLLVKQHVRLCLQTWVCIESHWHSRVPQ